MGERFRIQELLKNNRSFARDCLVDPRRHSLIFGSLRRVTNNIQDADGNRPHIGPKLGVKNAHPQFYSPQH